MNHPPEDTPMPIPEHLITSLAHIAIGLYIGVGFFLFIITSSLIWLLL